MRDISARHVQWIDATPVAARADLAPIAFAATRWHGPRVSGVTQTSDAAI